MKLVPFKESCYIFIQLKKVLDGATRQYLKYSSNYDYSETKLSRMAFLKEKKKKKEKNVYQEIICISRMYIKIHSEKTHTQ